MGSLKKVKRTWPMQPVWVVQFTCIIFKCFVAVFVASHQLFRPSQLVTFFSFRMASFTERQQVCRSLKTCLLLPEELISTNKHAACLPRSNKAAGEWLSNVTRGKGMQEKYYVTSRYGSGACVELLCINITMKTAKEIKSVAPFVRVDANGNTTNWMKESLARRKLLRVCLREEEHTIIFISAPFKSRR